MYSILGKRRKTRRKTKNGGANVWWCQGVQVTFQQRDQLRAEMKAGKVFQGMHEDLIWFPPTYKFERHKQGLAGYDSGEKKRIPAWCDRVLYRDSRSTVSAECSLRCPVVASVLMYEACMDVTESDHKPVRCKYSVDIAHVDRSVRREEFGKVLKSNDSIRSMLAELHQVPETTVSADTVYLKNQDTSVLRITNKNQMEMVVFRFICDGLSTWKEDADASELRARGSFGFPRWLEVTPAVGVLQPEQSLEVSVHYEENCTEDSADGTPQNWWSEDIRDKEVLLSLIIQGSCTTERISHQIHVRHSFTGKTSPTTTDSSKGSSNNGCNKINQVSSGLSSKNNQASSGSGSKTNQACSSSSSKNNQVGSGSVSNSKNNQASSGSGSKTNQACSSSSSKNHQVGSGSVSASSSKNNQVGSGSVSSSKNSQVGLDSGSSSGLAQRVDIRHNSSRQSNDDHRNQHP